MNGNGTLRAGIVLIVRSGLSTLRDLRLLRLTDLLPPSKRGSREVPTMMKSSMFQLSLR
jgi:hypothetical protein